MHSVAQQLQSHGLFQLVGIRETQPMLFRQSVDAQVEAFHASNGFSRQRMGAERATAFDQEIGQLLRKHYPTGEVEQGISARVIYGKPLDPNS